jgi:hypothetical protein
MTTRSSYPPKGGSSKGGSSNNVDNRAGNRPSVLTKMVNDRRITKVTPGGKGK